MSSGRSTLDPSVRSKGVVIVSPGGRTGRGGMASVTRTMAEWIDSSDVGIAAFVVDARGRGSSWMWPLFFFKAVAEVLVLRLTGRATILHLQVSERNSFIRKGLLLDLGRALGMDVVLHHHGAELIPFYHSTSAPMRWWTRRTVHRAGYNIVLGERWRSFLCEDLAAPADRVGIVFNASVDLAAAVAAQRQAAAPTPAGLRVLVMANLSPRKGIAEFLLALQQLRDEGVAITATLAGGGEVERYREEARTLGLSSLCRFTGWVGRDQVVELLANADCLALPSYEEGLPIAILEALGCHLPIVATPVGSIGEVLTDGRDCLLVAPGDVTGLANALRRLAEDPALRNSLSENGRQLFEQQFSIERFMAATLNIYDDLAERRSVA